MSSVAVPARKIRPEIQGLRAVAVGAVLLFHVWPELLPGGYVGVDVFFVVSGFLITSLLVREAENHGRIRFGEFYLRRAKRLLPAATLVLSFVALGTVLLLPPSLWEDTAWEVLASVFYVENWRLAYLAVDYLGSENVASPVQHYWSLSIEEQFYLLWPALIAACLLLVKGKLELRTVLRAAFLTVFIWSLWMSIRITEENPAAAYFVSHTRVWELALGGLLAVVHVPLVRRAREAAGTVGIVAILFASYTYSAETAFPGLAALVPTLGAALVILGQDCSSRVNPATLLSTKPFQFLGDISYSVYLWHWPLIVFFLSETGAASIGLLSGFIIIGATISASVFTKLYVEDRFRVVPVSLPWAPALAKATAIALIPLIGVAYIFDRVGQEQVTLNAVDANYPGAAAIGSDFSEGEDFVPKLSVVKRDRAEAYSNGCHLGFSDIDPVACEYGDSEGSYRVFLVGDSHAANWIPALRTIAEDQGWAARSYTKSSCALMPVMLRRSGSPYEECFAWGSRVREIISNEKPDLVILAQMYSHRVHPPAIGEPVSMRDGLLELWREIEGAGVQVVVVGDTPRWTSDPDACLARDRNCAVSLSSIKNDDPLLDAHELEPRVGFIDMNDVVCPDRSCPAVIGNVVVWRDRHHITATYSASASSIFHKRLIESKSISAELARKDM